MSSNYRKLQSQRATKKLSDLEKRQDINSKLKRKLCLPCIALAIIVIYLILIASGSIVMDRTTLLLFIFMICAICYYTPQIISLYKERKLLYKETK